MHEMHAASPGQACLIQTVMRLWVLATSQDLCNFLVPTIVANLWQSHCDCARRNLLFVFLHDVATMERAGSARPVPSPVVRRLLTERLVTVPPDTVSDKAAALFHSALQHVALKARARLRIGSPES